MGNFVHATFSGGVDFDPFTGYVGEVGGLWTNRGGDSNAHLYTDGTVRGFDAGGWWTAAGVPGAADYTCTAYELIYNAFFARGGGPLGRYEIATGKFYMFMYNYTPLWILYYYDGSGFNALDSVSASDVVDGQNCDVAVSGETDHRMEGSHQHVSYRENAKVAHAGAPL